MSENCIEVLKITSGVELSKIAAHNTLTIQTNGFVLDKDLSKMRKTLNTRQGNYLFKHLLKPLHIHVRTSQVKSAKVYTRYLSKQPATPCPFESLTICLRNKCGC